MENPLEPIPAEEMLLSKAEITTERLDEVVRGALVTRAQELDVQVHDAL